MEKVFAKISIETCFDLIKLIMNQSLQIFPWKFVGKSNIYWKQISWLACNLQSRWTFLFIYLKANFTFLAKYVLHTESGSLCVCGVQNFREWNIKYFSNDFMDFQSNYKQHKYMKLKINTQTDLAVCTYVKRAKFDTTTTATSYVQNVRMLYTHIMDLSVLWYTYTHDV